MSEAMNETKKAVSELKPTNDQIIDALNVLNEKKDSQLDEELTEEEKKFMEELDEKYKDRDDYKDNPVIEETQKVSVAPDGTVENIDDDNTGSVKESDNGAEILKNMMESSDNLDTAKMPSEESVSKELSEVYGIDDSEAAEFAMVLFRIKNGEKFNIYAAMPEKFKSLINMGLSSNGIPATIENKNIAARAMVNDILASAEADDSFIELNQAISEIANVPNLFDFESEAWQETIEIKLVEAAESYKEEHPKIAESLLKIRDSWIDSYTYRRQLEILNSDKARRIISDMSKYSKYMTDFTFKAEASKFKINDIQIMPRALKKYFGDEYDEYIYKVFTLLMAKCFTCLDYNNPSDGAFIFYSIKHVITLEFLDKNRITSFNTTLTENIKSILDRLVILDSEFVPKNKKEKKYARRHNA